MCRQEDRQQIRLWLDLLLERKPGQIHITEEGFQASVATGMYYYDLVQQRRATPADDMISRLIETEIERDGQVEKLSDVDITGFATLLGGAGAETVTKLIGNAMVAFADFPSEWQKLRRDRTKIPAAVEELLRYEAPSQYQVRVATRDVTMYDTMIPEGSAVLLVTGSATRDERMFPDPTVSTSTANARWVSTLPWVTASTAVSVPRSPAWKAASRSKRCWTSFPSTRSTGTACAGSRCRTCRAGPTYPCAPYAERSGSATAARR